MPQQSRVSEPPSPFWSQLPPQDPRPDLEWGSELPGSGHGAFASTSWLSSPPPPRPVSRTVSPLPGSWCFRLHSGLWGSPLGPGKGCEVGGGRGHPAEPHRGVCVFAVQEPRAGGPEAWGAQSILHSGARGGFSWTQRTRSSQHQVPASTGRGRAARVHFLRLLPPITTNVVAKSNADVFSLVF